MKDTRETSVPMVEDYGLGYRLIWGPEDITAIVSHLSEDRQELKCEICFTYTESQAHIKQQRLVCNSSSGKTSLARDLRSQANHVNWDAIIEQLTFKTIERHRQGNPPEIIHIDQSDAVIPPKFLVWPFIIDKEMNLLYARGGKGKTLVMQTILVLSQTGDAKNGLGLGISRPTIGGILDYESTNSSLRYRATRLLRGMDIPSIDIEYQSCHGSITENLEKIGN